MKRVKVLISNIVLVCVVTMFVALQAQASSISYSDSFDNLLTELNGEELRVSQFDSSLGTLTGVSITMSANLSSSGNVINTAAQNQTFTVSTRVESFIAELASGGPSVLADYEIIPELTLINRQSYTNLSPNTNAAFGPADYATAVLAVYDTTAAASLAGFIGTSDFGYDVNTSILTSISGGGGNVLTAIETLAGATLTVEYMYDEVAPPPVSTVPEPSTVTLLSFGVLGLAAVARKRMSK